MSHCQYCGSTSYGLSCPISPNKLHVHMDGTGCPYCGSTSKGNTCPLSPDPQHRHGLYLGGSSGSGNTISQNRDEHPSIDRRDIERQNKLDRKQQEMEREQLRLAEEQNAILAEQAETASRLAEDEVRHRKEHAERQQEREEQTLDRKIKNFLVLIRHGDLSEIKDILREGDFEVDNAAFVVPVFFGENNPATEYLKQFVSVDALDKEGMTALMRSVQAGDGELVTRLLDAGVNINVQSNEGRTAVMMASATGNVAIMNQLLARGADLSLRDHDGNSPLMWAADNGHLNVCQILVAAGLDVDEHDVVGCSALNHCALCLDWIVSLPTGNMNSKEKEQWMADPVHAQQIQSFLDTAEFLIGSGANADNKDFQGNTARSLLKKYTKHKRSPSQAKVAKNKEQSNILTNESNQDKKTNLPESQVDAKLTKKQKQQRKPKKAKKKWWEFWK